jgi:RNA-directed DNA polymerase
VSKAKPFAISKQAVWAAYRKVKANDGVGGVDGVSMAQFEQRLSANLYKLWNRLSSGTYFPPPVRLVEIPKKGGGVRPLGVPTVADRIAQTVVAAELEAKVEPIFHPDSYGYRPGRSAPPGAGGVPAALLAVRLGHRLGYQVVFRLDRPPVAAQSGRAPQ